MEHTAEEEERIKAIQRYLEGERDVDIYKSLERSKGWFNKWLGRYKTGRKGWYNDLPKRARVIPNTPVWVQRLSSFIGMGGVTKHRRMDYVGPRHITGYGPINSLHLKDVVGRQVAGQQYNEKSIQSLREIGFMCRNRSGVHRSIKTLDERNDRGIQ